MQSKMCCARASPLASVGGKNARVGFTSGDRLSPSIPPKCESSHLHVSRCQASSSGSRKFLRPKISCYSCAGYLLSKENLPRPAHQNIARVLVCVLDLNATKDSEYVFRL
jgi:hypothetical protein